jgi:hypothetical protein
LLIWRLECVGYHVTFEPAMNARRARLKAIRRGWGGGTGDVRATQVDDNGGPVPEPVAAYRVA